MDDRLLGQPHSGCIVNGEIATEPNGWNRAGRGDEIEKLQEIGFVVLDQDKKMWIDDMNFEAKVINAANESFAIAEVNRIRNENEIVLYNHFTGQTTSDIDGTDVLIKPVEGASWGLNKDVECVVTRIVQSKGGTELEEGEYALSGNGTGAEFLNQMNVGDKVKINTKLTTRTDNLIPIAEQMLTGNALVMREGKLTPRNENEAYNSQTYSRSGIGMSQDGKTLYLIVIDYKSSTSVGTNTATMCYILKQAGAWNVANMDAGGSAQMMLRGKLVNNPADGKERPVSNGFMIFTNAPEDNTLNSLAFDNYNLEVPSYSCFEPTILGYNSYGVLIDTDVQEFTLSCDASLGTISSDGKKFYASPNATSGYLHVTSGTATGKIKVTVKEADIVMKNSEIIADKAHPYSLEVASDTEHPYAVTDAAYAALIKLIADICKRNGIKKLIWSTNKADRVNHANGCNMTVHRDYANKACPGQYLYDRHGAIAAAVNELLGSGTTQPSEAAPGAVQGFPATPFTVRVIIPDLNYRKGPGMSYAVRGQTGKGVFTITEVQDGWGKLKSGAGWIYLENPDYCTIQGVPAKPAEPDPADVLAQEIADKVKGSGLDPADVLNRTKKILGVA